MTDLDALASKLLIDLGIPTAGSFARVMLMAALKKEGDSRAAEMRERCAKKVRTALHRNGHHIDANKIAGQVRSLPLSPAEEKPNAD